MERGSDNVLIIQLSTEPHSSILAPTSEAARHVVADDAQALVGILAGCSASFVILCGDWGDLTVDASLCLSDWALKSPVRGFSILPGTTSLEALEPGTATPQTGPKLVSVRQAEGTVLISDQTQALTPQSFAALYDLSSPPIATSLIVHGAEHCISFLGTWLTAHRAFAPTPDTIHPAHLRGAALFIGSCGVLRLGDSIVPQAYSLPAHFLRGFPIVIGAFRTISPSPNAERIFRDGLFGGACAGTIVNQLNADHIAQNGGGPAYTMLGDASVRLRAAYRTTFPATSATTDKAQVPEALTASFVWWDLFAHQCARAGLVSTATQEALTAYGETWRNLRPLCLQSCPLDPQDLSAAVTLMVHLRDTLRQSLLVDIIERIFQGKWIIAGFARQSPQAQTTETSCPRCGGLSLRTTIDLLGDRSTTLVRDECNRCSTTRDRIGDIPDKAPIRVTRSGDSLEVHTDLLHQDEVGYVLMHRDDANQLFGFPPPDSCVQIPLAAINMRGRRVVVALSAGPTGLQCQYDSTFLDP